MTADTPKDRATLPPSKPKGRWNRIFGRFCLALVLVAIASHGIWSIVESHLLKKQIAAIRAAGEPILPEDLIVPNVDAPDNAVAQLLGAGKMVKRDDDAWRDFAALEPAFPLRPDEVKTIDAIVGRSGAALDRVANAQKLTRMDWPPFHILSGPDQEIFADVRQLAYVLGTAAMVDHQRGDDRAALRHIRQIMFIAQVTDRHPSLLGHLVAVGVHAIAVNKILQITPDLRVGGNEIDANADAVRETIGNLLDDRAIRDGFIRGMIGERVLSLDMSRNMIYGNKSGVASMIGRYGIRPLLNHNARFVVEEMTRVIPVGNLPNWPTARPAIPARSEGNSPLTMFARIIEPAFDRAVEHHFRILTDQHLAAVALALRWYAVDHDGKLPVTLDELVPKYLPTVPRDPMAASDKSLLYHAGDDPIVYSVGANGTDDSGSEKPLPTSHGEANEWTRLDRVVHLKRQPRQEDR
ncbi:MAG TPA: hypothetical protein VH370_21865 [Humisphaera sp.]|nr:hypothetical protein [Humisphaera sp.]